MAPKYTAPSLQDKPVGLAEKFPGYFHNTDDTMLPSNALIFPSQNCFIPNKDKIVPRLGSTLLGQAATADKIWPIIGHKERFATMGGAEVEVRVEETDDADLKNLISVLYPNPVTDVPTWYQITEDVNPLTPAVGKLGMRPRAYFDDWFDTNLNPSLSLNLPRLVGVNGTRETITWTGGIAVIGTIVVNTSITTANGETWASQGFVDPALGGSGNITVRGTAYAITGGWATSTLTLASTTGLVTNDVAFSQIQTDTSPIAFDMCRQNKNYMFYGSWNSRKLFMSNGFNRSASSSITGVQAAQNDLVVGTSPYTGTGEHVYRVTIDSVNPPVNQQTFASPAGGGLDDGLYKTSAYSGAAGVLNNYSVLMIGELDLIVTPSGGPGFVVGDIVVGSTSGAKGVIVFKLVTGMTNTLGLAVNGTIPFIAGEVVTDSGNGTTATVVGSVAQNYFQYLKNGAVVNVNVGTGLGPLPINPLQTTVMTLSDGLTIQFSNSFGHAVGDVFKLAINQGGHDTFQWQIDGAAPAATFVAITGTVQTLSLGLQISFVSKTGHKVGDYWDITVDQAITKAWTNFYYTLPVRKPGEGYVYQLPSNFWTMAPQEKEMYVNTRYGYWSYVETTLSADLQSETVSLQPLKQAASSKVIFPYMIDYLDDDLIYVTENKTLDLIGRKQFLELPQTSNLSQPVALDFEAVTFEDGSMKYLSKRLNITSPREGVMFVYDNNVDNKYWQPPQLIPGNAMLSVYRNSLISHSNIQNQTLTLFSGTKGDNGAAYTFRARTAYNSYGDRWWQKNSNAAFTEGYIEGVPPLIHTAYLGVNGCGGIFPHDVKPKVCRPTTRAPLGEGDLGSHSFGSDLITPSPYFSELYKQYDPILKYYFAALEIECTTKTHSYSILTLGLNAIEANTGNNNLINEQVISRD